MRFYDGEHKYYCGVDLHARTMYVSIIDLSTGQKLNTKAKVTMSEVKRLGLSNRLCKWLIS